MSGNAFVGFDLETTSSDLSKGAKICQFGLAFGAADTFVRDVGWNIERDAVHVSEEALGINHFTRERIEAGERVDVVEQAVIAWLGARPLHDHQLVAIGWNVAGFDMPFVKQQMPELMKWFSHRTIDLNAICYAIGGKGGKNYKTWKAEAKAWAAQVIGGVEQWHDAGYDAVAGLLAFYWLKEQVWK